MELRHCTIVIMIILLASCSSGSNSATNVATNEPTADVDSVEIPTAKIFGTTIHLDELNAIEELSDAGIMKYDTINVIDGEFAGAVVEFAGVKFGMNNGFLFLTSRQDMQAIDSLISEISKYYGEPTIDDDGSGEPEWSYYHWNLYDTIPDRPYIGIRPIHSDEGGLVMSWMLENSLSN